ncbi:MAG: potassium/proton antiporter [Bacteroidales bacterium]|nr:potassium/proton antiporter [Bacteroidales bacterium]
MIFTSGNIILLGAVLIFVSILVSKTGFRFGVPTLLLFLLVGMLFGSDGLGLEFNSPESAQFIGMIALSVILFTGGMDTQIADIKPIITPGLILSTMALLLTTLLTGAFIYCLCMFTGMNMEFSLLASFLLAATMSSTDSASVFSILRSQKMQLKHNLKPLLELESGSNDPMAYMLTIILIHVIQHPGEINGWGIALDMAKQFGYAIILSVLVGKGIVWLINKISLSNTALYSVMLLSVVFILFAVTDSIGGNGYLAVYIAGLVVGNSKVVLKREMSLFMDSLTWLFQVIMFLSLGLLVNPHELKDVAIPGILIGAFMMFVARPLSVYTCLAPFKDIPLKAQTFTSWVGLRGAVPIIFATYPVVADIPGSNIIFNIVFFITLISLIFQGMSIGWFAKKLHLDLPPEPEKEFDIHIPDELSTSLNEIRITRKMLAHGNTLATMNIPKGHLAMIVKRGGQYIVPNGQLELHEGDVLLFISSTEHTPEN